MRGPGLRLEDPAPVADAIEYPHGVRALEGIDLAIPRGSLVGLLGANGSGTSTTVKILCGLIRAFEGEAGVEGARLPDRGVARRLGCMPPQTALYTELSVQENLDFYASINGVRPAAERKRRIDGMLGLLELSEKRREPVEALSGGMRLEPIGKLIDDGRSR